MKYFNRLLIISFILVSLLIIKDDILLVLGSISSPLNKNKESLGVELKEKKILPLSNDIDTPGALRVISNLLNINDNIKLSKDNIIKLTNQQRAQNNLSPLIENNKLNLSAEKKLQDMFDNQYFEHLSPTGIGVSELGEGVGYEYILIGENLAMGNFKDDEALISAWMNSLGHRENILNKNYIEIGIAVGQGNFEGKKVWVAIQHFGTPKNVCPNIDKILYGIININQNKIKEMESDLSLRRDKINKRVIFEGRTHYEQIEIYNNLVNLYNDLILETKQKTDIYNNQIQMFNLCLSNYQK